MGLDNSPLCRCGAEDETSAPTLCEYEALASFIREHLSFSLDPEGIVAYVWGSSGTLAIEQGSLELVSDFGAQWACVSGLGASGLKGNKHNC